MAISTADFKNGMCIMYNNKMCTIIEFQHVKPGKGGAFVRMKLRDIKTGRVLSDTVNAGVKFDTVQQLRAVLPPDRSRRRCRSVAQRKRSRHAGIRRR